MKIFVLGATGYIGGTVAETLRALGHEVIATARDDAKVRALAARGIAATLATLDDSDALIAVAKNADAVINAASADHRPSVEALMQALSGTGKRFIHTSGSSIVATDAGGTLVPAIYDETTPYQPIPERRARVAMDHMIREGAARGVHSAIICPSLVYGRASGLHQESVQVPALIREAHRGRMARHIGLGDNVWSNVHVEDLADLYVAVLERAPAGSFFFAENGEAAMRDVVGAIGRRYELPIGSIDMAEASERWGAGLARFALGSNSRVRGVRARELGWQPRRHSLLESIALESDRAAE